LLAAEEGERAADGERREGDGEKGGEELHVMALMSGGGYG